MYPEYAEIKGKKYKIDTDYRTALRCFEVVNDPNITDFERAKAIVYLLFDFIPEKDFDLFLEKAKTFLECGDSKNNQKNGKKDMDFEKDRSYIVASFMSDYHINITQEKLHFWYFIELIVGLKEDCVLNRIRDIRNYDINEIKDPHARSKMLEAKMMFSLEDNSKMPTKEQEKSAMAFYQQLRKE